MNLFAVVSSTTPSPTALAPKSNATAVLSDAFAIAVEGGAAPDGRSMDPSPMPSPPGHLLNLGHTTLADNPLDASVPSGPTAAPSALGAIISLASTIEKLGQAEIGRRETGTDYPLSDLARSDCQSPPEPLPTPSALQGPSSTNDQAEAETTPPAFSDLAAQRAETPSIFSGSRWYGFARESSKGLEPSTVRSNMSALTTLTASANTVFIAVETQIAAVATSLASSIIPRISTDNARSRDGSPGGNSISTRSPYALTPPEQDIAPDILIAETSREAEPAQPQNDQELAILQSKSVRSGNAPFVGSSGQSVVGQVAASIASAIGDGVGRSLPLLPTAIPTTGGMGEPPPASSTGQDVTKSLRIVLNPADLGTVAVRMTMRGDTLRVHLRFETPEAAQVAAVERNKLSDALENTGLRLDHLVVDTVAQATRGAEASRPNTFSADTGASSGNSPGPQRDDTGARTPHRSDKSPSERPELAKETRDSGLYV